MGQMHYLVQTDEWIACSESAQFALCAFQMSSGAWSTWADQGAQSVPNSRFIAQALFTIFSECTKTSDSA